MGKKEREEILQYASMRYGTEAEYLWKTSPSYAVLRHAENRKWYGVLMNVPRERLVLCQDLAQIKMRNLSPS